MARGGGLFGRIALEKGLVSAAGLERALRVQSELRAFGLKKQIGELLLRDGSLSAEGLSRIVKLQRRNENRREARLFARVVLRRELAPAAEVKAALAALRREGYVRGLGAVLVERGALTEAYARAVERALARAAGQRGADTVRLHAPPRTEAPSAETVRLDAAQTAALFSETIRLRPDQAAGLAPAPGTEVELQPADLPRAGRQDDEAYERDLLFAAVALRDGLVLVPELQRALEQRRLTNDRRPLADALVEGGVLTPDLVGKALAGLEDARRERLTIPGYEVLDLLGHGSTSLVLRARHALMGREVAIKVRREERADAEAALAEARLTASVQHEHVVTLHEVGRVHRRLYFVMELVDGPTLMDRIRDASPLPEADVLRWGLCVARALGAVEAAGLVHRDVKPQNILLTPDGGAKLADLGLAREAGGRGPERPGAICGTPHTLSPEQARSGPLDIRSDLYSLGATLYHALAGRPPFDGDGPLSIVLGHLEGRVPSLRAARPDVRPATAALVERLLAKEPSRRPPGPAALVADLERLLAG